MKAVAVQFVSFSTASCGCQLGLPFTCAHAPFTRRTTPMISSGLKSKMDRVISTNALSWGLCARSWQYTAAFFIVEYIHVYSFIITWVVCYIHVKSWCEWYCWCKENSYSLRWIIIRLVYSTLKFVNHMLNKLSKLCSMNGVPRKWHLHVGRRSPTT